MNKKNYMSMLIVMVILTTVLIYTSECRGEIDDLTTELFKKPFHRNLKIFTPFTIDNGRITHGSFDLEQNTDEGYIKYSGENLKLTVTPTVDSDQNRIEFEFKSPINLYKKNFGLWYYLPNGSIVTSQRAKFNTFAFYLYTRNEGVFAVYPSRGFHAYEGWNYLLGNSFNGRFLTDNPLSDLEEVYVIRLHINKEKTADQIPYTIYVDSIMVWDEIGIATARIEFDDGYKSVYGNAFPLMRERGIRGCINVITDKLLEPSQGYLTKEELHRMHDVGWDVTSHSHTHPRVSELTDDEIFNEMVNSQKILLDLGFRNGPQFYVAPYGDNTPYALEIAKRYYQNYRMTGYRKMDTVVPANPYGMEVIGMGSRTLEEAKTLVDLAVEKGGFLPMMWHGEIGVEWGGVKWELEEFRDLLDYLLEKGVQVVTYSDQFPGTQIWQGHGF